MSHDRRILELLAPAKNADFGMAAIDHGADAVYIGGPAFGARVNAGNKVTNIARLADYAHRFRARVYVTLNTILRDDEIETARQIAWQVYEAGADALLVQDMGLLEVDLPPIALHASTQVDTRDPAKARFLQDVGFSQIVLARELSLEQIRAIAEKTRCALEFFVHGALCVSYSGQCYLSHARTGRSANRGECSQACRLPYTLKDARGQVLAHERHLLSLKDNDQSANLRALAEAGISSFKIEGRLKDLSYVKNVTANYRILLDRLIEETGSYRRASSGLSVFTFAPQPEKSFNRGATDYFVNGRHHGIEAFDTPAFVGEPVGRVTCCGRDFIEIDGDVNLNNGDGFSYFDVHGELTGLRVNRAEGRRLFPATMPDDLAPGTELFRNRDQAFERTLEKTSAQRRVRIGMTLGETDEGFALHLVDEDGVYASASAVQEKTPAQNSDKAGGAVRAHLEKLGASMFTAVDIALELSLPWFIPASVLNGLRRAAVANLETARAQTRRRPERAAPVEPAAVYPADELSYLGNVLNRKARAFYERHGVRVIEAAFEANERRDDVPLMITKHCLRYSFNLCPLEARDDPARRGTIKAEPMTLVHGKEELTLRFDCKRCEMHVVGRSGRSTKTAPLTSRPQPGR